MQLSPFLLMGCSSLATLRLKWLLLLLSALFICAHVCGCWHRNHCKCICLSVCVWVVVPTVLWRQMRLSLQNFAAIFHFAHHKHPHLYAEHERVAATEKKLQQQQLQQQQKACTATLLVAAAVALIVIVAGAGVTTSFAPVGSLQNEVVTLVGVNKVSVSFFNAHLFL